MSDRTTIQPEPSIRLRGVWKYYRRGSEDIPAAADVSLDFYPGTLTCILGPSGGGKSTLLHMMGGMDRPTKGEIIVFGQDIARLRADELSAYRRTKVGFIFQSFHLFPTLTAQENVELPLVMAGVAASERKTRASQLLERFGLRDRTDHRPNQLSGGQAQRVAVARALAADAPIILADEPTGNLDSQSGEDIMKLLASVAHDDGRTVIVVTHNEEFVRYADRVIRIRDGRIHSDESVRFPSVPEAKPTGRSLRTVGAGTLARMALSAVRRRIGRAILTGMGIAIGVAAMVLLMGIGAGLKSGVVKGLTTLGPLTSISVSPHRQSGTSSGFTPNVATGPMTPITDDALKRLSSLPGAKAAYATATFVASVKQGGLQTEVNVVNLPPSSLWNIDGLLPTLQSGSWPTGGGIVLSSGTASALLGGAHPNPERLIGRTISVQPQAMAGGVFGGGTSFTPSIKQMPSETVKVTGIVKGSAFSYVSYSESMNWIHGITGKDHPDYPAATVIAQSIQDVNGLADRIGKLGYGTTTVQDILNSVTKAFSVVEIGLGVIGGIALVVAGLMIGVIMSMSVLERRREIGILRAVGARKKDISRLFLTEVGVIGLGGGIIGLGLGSGGGALANYLIHKAANSSSNIFQMPVWLIVLGLVFGAAVALIAGWIPASRAARFNPVDALRTD